MHAHEIEFKVIFLFFFFFLALLECNQGADIYFLLDASSSVPNTDFQTLLDTVANATTEFWKIYPSARIGVASYADNNLYSSSLSTQIFQTEFENGEKMIIN